MSLVSHASYLLTNLADDGVGETGAICNTTQQPVVYQADQGKGAANPTSGPPSFFF
jgi:hypothetical protein